MGRVEKDAGQGGVGPAARADEGDAVPPPLRRQGSLAERGQQVRVAAAAVPRDEVRRREARALDRKSVV